MTKLTKQQQKDNAGKTYEAIVNPAYEAYHAIARPAWKAYEAIIDHALKAYNAKLAEIDAQPDEIITHNGRKYKLMGGK